VKKVRRKVSKKSTKKTTKRRQRFGRAGSASSQGKPAKAFAQDNLTSGTTRDMEETAMVETAAVVDKVVDAAVDAAVVADAVLDKTEAQVVAQVRFGKSKLKALLSGPNKRLKKKLRSRFGYTRSSLERGLAQGPFPDMYGSSYDA